MWEIFFFIEFFTWHGKRNDGQWMDKSIKNEQQQQQQKNNVTQNDLWSQELLLEKMNNDVVP